jgi:hypothetical protein
MFDQMGTQFIYIMTLMFILFVGYFRVIFSNMIVESKPIVFDTILFFIWLSLTRYFVIYTNDSFNKYIKPKKPIDDKVDDDKK